MSKELQHYVPRFLLKNFAKGKKPQIFVYDKSNDKQFKTNIKNIAAETGFYDIKVDGISLVSNYRSSFATEIRNSTTAITK